MAIQQWVGQAATLYGLNINWQVSSSVIGLDNFAQNEIDFGASDIPYSSGQATSTPNHPYQYMPDVAGALAFMYNLTGAQTGTKITNLVLDAQVIDDIFSGAITTWNAPQIAQLNPAECRTPELQPAEYEDPGGLPGGRFRGELSAVRLPAPYGHVQLRGFPDCDGRGHRGQRSAIRLRPGPRSRGRYQPTGYPGWNNGDMVGQSGSDNAANYVSAAASNGAIAYVETAYANQHGDPVASVINQSGNAVQPTSVNDATALEKAMLYSDLTQNLTGRLHEPAAERIPALLVQLSGYALLALVGGGTALQVQWPEWDLLVSRRTEDRPWVSSSPSLLARASRRWLCSVIRRYRQTSCRRTSTR